MSNRILVIIPAWNEAVTVGDVVRRVRAQAPGAQALVVDDGSSDETAREAQAAGAEVLRLPFNLGIGGAVQTGLRYALEKGYDISIQVDADGQHPPEEIPKLLAALEREQADMVIGSRFLDDQSYRAPLMRRAGIRLFAALLSAVCGRKLTDTTSGFRAANRQALTHMAHVYACDYPEVEAIVSLHKAGFRIVETPVRMESRGGGRSSIGAIHAVYYIAKVVLAVLVDSLAAPRFTRDEVAAFLESYKPEGKRPC